MSRYASGRPVLAIDPGPVESAIVHLSAGLLERAFQNTVELLKREVVLEQAGREGGE